jgi:carbon-monoxide dehydrogenase medium subunit
MKLPVLDYVRPQSLDEAVALLRAAGGSAKLLAGGQSLMPTLAFRLATPSVLIDLAGVPGLDGIEATPDGGLVLGARVRWVDLERSHRVRVAQPLVAAAIEHVAHYQIRNRGTVGGSLAHADPAAEWPGLCVTCDALVDVLGSDGRRRLPAAEFVVGPLSTVLAEDEIITAIHLPAWPVGRRWAFQEFARRRGDFALAGVALFYDVDAAGCLANVHVGVIGACHKPQRLGAVEQLLEGRTVSDALFESAARCAAAEVDPPADLHGSAAYRRGLVQTLLGRALAQARDRLH